MGEEEYRFDEAPKAKVSAVAGLAKFIWNSETKEFCGRDGASWGKVSLFYAIFYLCLGSFFVGMLAVFVQIMPKDKPTYYGLSSTMNARGLNPGLGFRPQIDVEDSIIHYDPRVLESEKDRGFSQLVQNLQIFLKSKYPAIPADEKSNVQPCQNGKDYTSDLVTGKSCEFDYEKVFQSTPCTYEKKFGYETNTPCVLVKLNKIIDWKPEFDANTTAIVVKCEGETSVDKDNLYKVTYHSENHLFDTEAGYIDSKYFPYFHQSTYRAPFMFVQLDILQNTLVNIECKAYAKNIDNKDRMNRRGQTKFGLFVINKRV